ncbi:MAG: hypothetical protein LBP92_03915 [Deltaproteobacteria bacterium]|jgi:hypothetical protein|nr:hypothetical protein [Deltaproteobacteria bacterium]
MTCLHDIEVPNIKRNGDYYLWADYLELLCLLSQDNEVTINVLDEFMGVDKGMHIDEDIIDDITYFDSTQSDLTTEIFNNSDKISLIYDDLSRIFYTRLSIFGDKYPFICNINNKTIFNKKEYSYDNLLYIFLLIAGNTRLFKKNFQQNLANDFEQLATDALRIIFPKPWEWRHFGTAKHTTVDSYLGTKYSKLKILSDDINAKLIVEECNFSKFDTKDAGFDFVCWYPFDGDRASHLPLVFAQSTCTSNLDTLIIKQYSVLDDRIKNYFTQICCYNILLTPVFFRDAAGYFTRPHELVSVIIDRFRIMQLISYNIKMFTKLNSYCGITNSFPSINEKLYYGK